MTTVASRKAKGRNLQNLVRDSIRALLKPYNVVDDDVRSTPMGVTGADIQLSPLAALHFPYNVECKNVEKLNIWDAYSQATSPSRGADSAREPLLVIKRNRSPVLAVINFDHFLELCRARSID